jgi:ATP-dependent exoDNAse (exonuclease V) beta subunit
VLIGAAAKAAGTGPHGALRAGVEDLAPQDRARLAHFVDWFEAERALVPRLGLEELIDRALERTGYDLWVLGQPGGRRRLANVRKLMRLAREHEAEHGPDLRAFLGRVAERAHAGDSRESEAPVEGEALDAVRLMTVHRSKGLEFDVVCVADLGRARWASYGVMRVSGDGRFGLRLAEPGSGRKEPALHYTALGDERLAAEEAEERRLFYVAMTRARERLVLSGAARLETWPDSNGGTPISWIAPALIPDFAQRIAQERGVTERGVAFALHREADAEAQAATETAPAATDTLAPSAPPPAALRPAPPSPAPLTLSYSSLTEYRRCGYRFYAERVLGLPAQPVAGGAPATPDADRRAHRPAAERGILAHAVLESVDFRRPLAPPAAALQRICAGRGLRSPDPAEVQELAELVEAFASTELCRRLAHATQVRREQRFNFALGPELVVTGALDVVARERTGMLVVDYKTDRLADRSPAAVVEAEYATQQLVYALAVLLTGAARVEVAHVFLERPDEPVVGVFTDADRDGLTARLQELTAGVRARRFEVSPEPVRALCDGCPAQGGLCSWPLAMTRRERADQLF